MGYDEILFETPEPRIARLVLNRPERMNAYTLRMCREMCDALERYERDDDLRALVVTGAGRGFCSGGDIGGGDEDHQAMMERHLGHAVEMREGFHRVALALRRLDKPVVAAVNGPAVAGGLTLALLCDIRVASGRARAGDPSGRAGLLPDEGGAWLFPRAMGIDRALRMTLLNEVYDAAEALRLGLFTEVVPHDRLEERAAEVARALASRAPLAVRLAKRLMMDGLEQSFERSLEQAALAVMITNPSEDAREGVRAFREKREPDFRGR